MGGGAAGCSIDERESLRPFGTAWNRFCMWCHRKPSSVIQRRSLRQEFPAEYGQIEQHSTRKASARNYITMQMNEIVNTFKNVLKKDNDDIADL